jgi:MoxR-like ATPase
MTNTFADALGCDFKRVQFTPDLLPADITGTNIYDAKKGEFTFKPGPLFCNLLLADEINRAPPKTQAALLEAMQEKQVTIGTVTHKLPAPFIVMATQNPVEQEGTYPLPEAQMDRFMLKCVISYPEFDDEQQIIRSNINESFEKVKAVVSTKEILSAQEAVKEVYMDDKIEKYILKLIFATRFPENNGLSDLKPIIGFGSSPRGSINLAKAAKCNAFINRRGYVIPDDVREVIYDVLRHRIGLTYEAEAENITTQDVISKIVNSVDVP